MKKCLFCEKIIIKKDYENNRDFNRRKYCNEECFHKHLIQKRKERLIGKCFGSLVVQDVFKQDEEYYVSVKCECGNIKKYKLSGFKASKPTHCGCNHNGKTHGMSKTRLYKSWCAMKRRCDNPDELHKKYYANKGIKYCNEWSIFENFKNWAINNGYIDGYTIERFDNSKGYYPENCTWIPATDQNKNKTNKSHLIIEGIDKSYTEWAKEYGLNETTIRMRVKLGWKGKDLLRPPKKGR